MARGILSTLCSLLEDVSIVFADTEVLVFTPASSLHQLSNDSKRKSSGVAVKSGIHGTSSYHDQRSLVNRCQELNCEQDIHPQVTNSCSQKKRHMCKGSVDWHHLFEHERPKAQTQ